MEIYFAHPEIEKFIDNLESKSYGNTVATIESLGRLGNSLGMPYSRFLERGLFELRISGEQEVQIMYTFLENRAIILSGFIKKTEKTPTRELKKARNRKKFLEEKYLI